MQQRREDVQDQLQRPIPASFQIKADRLGMYNVLMTRNILGDCCDLLTDLIGARSILVVTTPTVAQWYTREIWGQLRSHADNATFMVLNCNEATKSFDQVMQVYDRVCDLGFDRTGILVAVGGGVCTDVVTMAASWIRRGISHIRVPTTLIGQIDAGIGIKGAVNFRGHKSFLGCFFPPKAVVITPAFLRTLPRSDLQAGFAEIVKIAMIRDLHLFDLVERHAQELLSSGFQHPAKAAEEILGRSISLMLEELEPNIYEDQTHQRLVNFGHTFSPVLEEASGFAMSHGAAVAIDIALSMALAEQLGLLCSEVKAQVLRVLVDVGLPISSPLLTVELCQRGLREATRHRGGQPNLVVPTGIGEAMFLKRPDALTARLMARAICMLEDKSSAVTERVR